MTSFYQNKYNLTTTRFYEVGQKLMFQDEVMLTYDIYQLPPDVGGVELCVMTDTFFDDRLSAFDNTTALQNRGRTFWMLDWSDIQIGIAEANSATRQTNIADNLYNCVITPNVNHYQLNSTKWTSIIEDPARHTLIDNFNSSCPTVTVTHCATD
jgi:hypothetical protein